MAPEWYAAVLFALTFLLMICNAVLARKKHAAGLSISWKVLFCIRVFVGPLHVIYVPSPAVALCRRKGSEPPPTRWLAHPLPYILGRRNSIAKALLDTVVLEAVAVPRPAVRELHRIGRSPPFAPPSTPPSRRKRCDSPGSSRGGVLHSDHCATVTMSGEEW